MPRYKALIKMWQVLSFPSQVLTWFGLIQLFIFSLVRFLVLGITKEVIFAGEYDNFHCNVTDYQSGGFIDRDMCYRRYSGSATVSLLLAVHAVAIIVVWIAYLYYAKQGNRKLGQRFTSDSCCYDSHTRLLIGYHIQTLLRIVLEVIFISFTVSKITINTPAVFPCATAYYGDAASGPVAMFGCTVIRSEEKAFFLHAVLVVDIVSLILALMDMTFVCISDNSKLFIGTRKYPYNGDLANHSSYASARYTPVSVPSPILHIPKSVPHFYRCHHMDLLQGAASEHSLVALTGPHGCGKTQLALQFAQDALQDGDISFAWELSASSAITLEHELYIILERLNIEVPKQVENTSEQAKVEILLQKLITQLNKRPGRIFFIFEDVGDHELGYMFENLFSRRDKYFCIITSNSPSVIRNTDAVVKMDGFSDNETNEFFKQEEIFVNASDADIVDIGQCLSNLPLGLSVARAYIASAEISIQDYLHQLQVGTNVGQMQTLQRKFLGHHYKKTLLQALQLSLKRIRDSGFRETTEAFETVSYLATHNIPIYLIQDALHDEMNDFLLKLKTYCLGFESEVDGVHVLSVHRATQIALLCMMEQYRQMTVLKQTLFLLVQHLDRDVKYSPNCKSHTFLLPQIENVIYHCKNSPLDFEGSIGWIQLYGMLGYVYSHRGLIASSENALKEAKTILYNLLRTSEDQLYAEAISRIMVHRRMSFREVTGDQLGDSKADLLFKMLTNTSYNSLDEADMLKLLCNRIMKAPDVRTLENKLGPGQVCIQTNTLLTQEMYADFVEEKVALPLSTMRRTYLVELLVAILYSHGYLYFHQHQAQISMKAEKKQAYINELKLAQRLCELIASNYRYHSIYSVLIERNALLYLDFESSRLGMKEVVANLEHAKGNYEDFLEDTKEYYHFGVLKMNNLKEDNYHLAICHRQLLRCCMQFIKLENHHDTEALFEEGQEHCDIMLQIIEQEMNAGHKIPQRSGFYNVAAEFAKLYENPHHLDQAIEYYNQAYEIEVAKEKVTPALIETTLGLARVYRQLDKIEDATAYAEEALRFAKQPSGNTKVYEDAVRLVRQIKMDESNYEMVV